MRIIFLGDSLTWGGYGGNFVGGVAERLPDHEIINTGVGGNTVVNLLRRLDSDVLEREPDGVFVMIGGNDAISYSQPKTRPYYRKSQNIEDGFVSPDTFARTYRELLNRLQLAHVQTWIGLPPVEYSQEIVATFQEYNARAAEIARSMNIPVLDLMEHFLPEDIPERPSLSLDHIDRIGQRVSSSWDDYKSAKEEAGYTFTFDGFHITPACAERIAELIVDFFDV